MISQGLFIKNLLRHLKKTPHNATTRGEGGRYWNRWTRQNIIIKNKKKKENNYKTKK